MYDVALHGFLYVTRGRVPTNRAHDKWGTIATKKKGGGGIQSGLLGKIAFSSVICEAGGKNSIISHT